MTATIEYYEVQVHYGNKNAKATFLRSSAGHFDLMYGWGRYMAGSHDTLEGALQDFRQHLEAEHPKSDVILGAPQKITQEQALENKPKRDNF
jgi:hypothetical protein